MKQIFVKKDDVLSAPKSGLNDFRSLKFLNILTLLPSLAAYLQNQQTTMVLKVFVFLCNFRKHSSKNEKWNYCT